MNRRIQTRVLFRWLNCLLVIAASALPFHTGHAQDVRSFQHGIDLIPLPDGQYKLIWSSSENPPQGANDDGNWPHDVFVSDIDPKAPRVVPVRLISRPEAQEPASSAINDDGHIMITMEDGWNADNVLAQRYGVYDSDLQPINPYPQDAFDGGHSGHVAAVGRQFVVFFSEEWVEGGGVDDLGSGDDVYVSVHQSDGRQVGITHIAVGRDTRDWWPMIAGSKRRALLLWQRFVDDETWSDLMFAIYNPLNQQMDQAPTRLATRQRYYTYDVQYLPAVDRFLVTATDNSDAGTAFLLNDRGNVIATCTNLPPFVREAQPAIRAAAASAPTVTRVAAPKATGGIMVLDVSTDSIALHSEQDGPAWYTAGTDGIFTADDQVYFVNLSPDGLLERTFRVETR